MERAQLDPASVQEVLMGNVVSTGVGQVLTNLNMLIRFRHSRGPYPHALIVILILT